MCRVSEFEEVNVLVCSKIVSLGAPEQAKQIAQQLGKSSFKGSNGWFGKWKARYNINMFSVCGESGDVQGYMVDSWKERLPEIVAGIRKKMFGTWMRMGCFGGLYQIRSLERKEMGVMEARSLSTD